MVLQDSETQKSYVKCPTCGKDAYKLYKEEDYDGIDDIIVLFEMKRTFQCSDKKDCAFVFQLSRKDIIKAFSKKVKAESMTEKDIIDGVSEAKEKLDKRFGDNVEL